MTPVISGLPGAGKSTTNAALSAILGKAVLSTDNLFRSYRALPSDSNAEGAEIMERFLKRLHKEHKSLHKRFNNAAKPDPGDHLGRNRLRDSAYFRTTGTHGDAQLGEHIFRMFEIEMNKWLYENGRFKGVIPDLSASALLYEENRVLFSRKNNFIPVLLDPSHTAMVSRLIKDFAQFERTGIVIRGRYEQAVDAALKVANPQTLCDRNALIKNKLSALSLSDRNERLPEYQKMNPVQIRVKINGDTNMVARKVINTCGLAPA